MTFLFFATFIIQLIGGGGGGGATVSGHSYWGANEIAYYSFDNTSGTDVPDETANGNDATAAGTDSTTGHIGTGWNGVVDLDAAHPSLDYNYVVVNYWINNTDWDATENHFRWGTSSTHYLDHGAINTTTGFINVGFNNTGTGATFWTESPPSNSTWAMITVVWRDAGVDEGAEIYLNGVSQGRNLRSQLDLSLHTGGTTYQQIAGNATMDEVGVWGATTAPSQTDIDDLYNSGTGIPWD